MKKWVGIFLLLMVGQGLAATATLRQGVYIDQYKIDDVGGDYHNSLLYFSHKVNEVVVQTSSVTYSTSKEALLCWGDNSILECPDDVIDAGPPVVYRMPAVKQLDDIQAAGGVTVGADLTDLQEKEVYLAFWHEYMFAGAIEDVLAEMITEELNALQQKRGLKFFIFGSADTTLATAKTIADARVDSGTKPTHNDYGIATVPLRWRRTLKLFGEVGWF